MHYLYVFLQSNLIEIPLFFLFYQGFARLSRVASVVTLSNAITHPIAFFALMAMKRNYLESTLVAEGFAIAVEALLHRKFVSGAAWSVTWKASAAANLISWQVAPILTYATLKIAA